MKPERTPPQVLRFNVHVQYVESVRNIYWKTLEASD